MSASPRQLLAAARTIESTAAVLPGATSWARSAAFMARLSLESAVDQRWRSLGHDLAECSWRTKLLALRWFAPEASAASIHQTWTSLSRACHHHHYELAPTATELEGWFDQVDAALLALTTPPAHGAAPIPDTATTQPSDGTP